MDPETFLGLARSVVVYRLNVAQLRRLRRLYRNFVQPGDLAFDVGAHVGDRVGALRALGCRVVAVEPQPVPMGFLSWLYGQAGDVILEPCALGATAGMSELLISRRNPTVSSLSEDWVRAVSGTDGFRHVTWDRRKSVPVETLDTLIARHGTPRFCKIDVEGMEPDVLRGLTQAIPFLSFEFTTARRDLALACMTEITRLGAYNFNIVYGETLALVLPEWLPGADLARHLERMPEAVASGDIYARHRDISDSSSAG